MFINHIMYSCEFKVDFLEIHGIGSVYFVDADKKFQITLNRVNIFKLRLSLFIDLKPRLVI